MSAKSPATASVWRVSLDPATTGPGKRRGKMGTVHRLVIEHGREAAMKKVDPAERHLVRIAAEILAEDDDAIGVTYSGFCQASLPHKKLPAEKEWIRRSERL